MKKYSGLFLLLIIFSFTGCFNLFNNEGQNYTCGVLEFTIDPSNPAGTARTAIPVFTGDVKYEGRIYKGDSVTGAPVDTFTENITGSDSFVKTLNVEAGSNYTLVVTGFDNNDKDILYAQQTISVPKNGKYSVRVPVYFIKNSEETGNVSLLFLIDNLQNYDIQKLKITGASELNSDFVEMTPLQVNSGEIIYTQNNVKCGDYEVIISFYNSNGNFIISVPEVISVRKNLTTTSWIAAGNKPYLAEQGDGSYNFVLTDDVIEKIISSTLYVNAEGGVYTNGFVEGAVISAASDSNYGTWASPLATIQEAVNRIIAVNDATTEYSIYFSGKTKETVSINTDPSNNNTSKKLSLSIIGDNVDKCIINGNSKGQVISTNSSPANLNLTLKNLQITGGSAIDGGGINCSNTNLVLNNVRIYGNEATQKGNGGYVSSTSTWSISGGTTISDELYLPDGVYLYVKDELTGSNGINVTYGIPEGGNAESVRTEPVIKREDGVTTPVTYALCSKFNILNGDGKYCLVPASLEDGGANLCGKVALIGATPTSVTYDVTTYRLRLDKNYFESRTADTVNLTVRSSSNVLLTSEELSNTTIVSNISMKLYQNGKAIPNVSSTGTSLPLPAWLPDGAYQVLVSAKIHGVVYNETVSIAINYIQNVEEMVSPPNGGKFKIKGKEGFLKLSQWAQNEHCDFEGCSFTLESDVTIEEGDKWKPLGIQPFRNQVFGFRGVLDGKGHTIEIKKPLTHYTDGNSSPYGRSYAGLVDTNYGEIKNIVFYSASYADTTDNYFGCFNNDNRDWSSTPQNSNSWWGEVGCFAAVNYGTIKNCWNRVNIYSSFRDGIGGIAGQNYGTIENCINTGNIKFTNWHSNHPRVGGIAGLTGGNEYEAHIKNCVNYAEMIHIVNRTRYPDYGYGGAILGAQWENSNLPNPPSRSIENCYYLENCIIYDTDKYDMILFVPDIVDPKWTNCRDNHYTPHMTISGCGSFNSQYFITAGTEANCYVNQTLVYDTNLINALNRYVKAHPGEGLSHWMSKSISGDKSIPALNFIE